MIFFGTVRLFAKCLLAPYSYRTVSSSITVFANPKVSSYDFVDSKIFSKLILAEKGPLFSLFTVLMTPKSHCLLSLMVLMKKFYFMSFEQLQADLVCPH